MRPGSPPPYLSREELARRMRALATPEELKTLAHVKSLARRIRAWECGEAAPSKKYQRLYAQALGVQEEDLCQPRPSSPSVPSSCPAAGHAAGRILGHEEDDVRRRTLLGLLAGATVAPWAQAEQARAAVHHAVASQATERDVTDWEQVAYAYAHEVGALPAVQVLPELMTDFADLGVLISKAREPVRTRLVHVAAQMAALTATALTGAGDPRSARRWWRTAARAADESGDREVATLVRGRQAVFSLYGDQSPLATLSIAEEAIAIGRSRPCSGVASGYAARAQALARLGRHQEAAAALQTLEELFDQLPDSTRDDQGWWGWPPQRLHHTASYVYAFAGDIERAGRAQDQALTLYRRPVSVGRTQVELHRASALLAAGDVDEGARHAVEVWERLPAGYREDRLVRRIAATSLALAPAGSTSRPALRDAYETLAITPLPEKR